MVWLAGKGLPQASPCELMTKPEICTPIASSRQSSGPAGRPAMPGEAVHRHVSRPGLAQHRSAAASACQGVLVHGSAPFPGWQSPELSRGGSFRSQAAHADPVCGAAKSKRGVCGRSRARSEP